MIISKYKVGDLVLLEMTDGETRLYVVITELSGVTIRVKNIVTGRVSRMPPRWFTKL